jgi:hypothetical protein
MDKNRTRHRAENVEKMRHGFERDATVPGKHIAVFDRDVHETHPERLHDPPFVCNCSVTLVADVDDSTNA